MYEAAREATKGKRKDRLVMLNKRIADGSWDSTRTTRKKRIANPACVRNRAGKLQGAKDRANVFAEYLHKDHFGRPEGYSYVIPEVLRNITLSPSKDLDHYFTDLDLRKAIRQLKRGKSSKPSGVPNEIWMLFLSHQGLRGDLLTFFNLCFAREQFLTNGLMGR